MCVIEISCGIAPNSNNTRTECKLPIVKPWEMDIADCHLAIYWDLL